MQDNKSLCAAVMIRATLVIVVNTQTDIQTAFDRLYYYSWANDVKALWQYKVWFLGHGVYYTYSYFAWSDTSILSCVVSTKLATNIRHVSGHCWKAFNVIGQRSRSLQVKMTTIPAVNDVVCS